MTKRANQTRERESAADKAEFAKNYDTPCANCGQKPTVGATELCGPCCFGEAAAAGGNW